MSTTSFTHVNYPTSHPGVVRAQRAIDGARRVVRGFDSARASASMLLAAIVAALLVVANQVIDTWTEGHLLAAWIALWLVAFASLALFAGPARRAAGAVRTAVKAWNTRRIEAAQDEQYWQAALQDARVMADISRAMSAAALKDIKTYY